MTLLHLPHHDGSPTYVDEEAPRLGDVVSVRMRSHTDDPIEDVWLRTTYDAEPVFHATTRTVDGHTTWWAADLPVHNPVTHYRFLIVRAEESQEWLTGTGLVDIDAPDASDFKLSSYAPAPDWARDGVVYQIFPDRFARSSAADQRPTPPWANPAGWTDTVLFEGSDPLMPVQLYGGDLDGITDHLDHVERVGATSSTRPRSSPARATTATTRPPSTRSTRCSAAMRPTNA